MFEMKLGSMGEMPPNTRLSPGFSAATAREAPLTMPAKIFQPGSRWKSQCERLFGSFQNITASITNPPLANEDFLLGTVDDLETGAAQHGFRAGAVRDPPVGVIARIRMLNEKHPGKRGPIEDFAIGERVVLFERLDFEAAAKQGLKDHRVLDYVLLKQIQRQQGVPQVIENAHEQHQ